MSKNPRRFAKPVKLIVSVEVEVVTAIDPLTARMVRPCPREDGA